MWLWSLAPAFAVCPFPLLSEPFPHDHDTGVAPTVRPTVLVAPLEAAPCMDPERVRLARGDRDAAFDVEASPGLVQVVPREPLEPGQWQLSIGTDVWTFTVEDPPRELVVPPVPDTTLDVVRHCEPDLAWTELRLEGFFPDPPPPGEALVQGFVTIDGLDEPIGATVYRGWTVRTTFVKEVLGYADACGWLEARDWEGELLWRTDEVCAAEPPCASEWPPVVDEEEPRGCATVGSGPWLLALLALRRRVR